MEVTQVFDEAECGEIYAYLDSIEVEYRKTYTRFGKKATVPRGQASFTLDTNIHYDYKVSGGSPPNHVMCGTLRGITQKVNAALHTNFNTILLNKYIDGRDCIGFHRDKETGWVENTGFATLAFGAERDFVVKNERETHCLSHRAGSVIHLPHPLNQEFEHSVPKRLKITEPRISLTFRELKPH
jgi:alkylated DNA repair dioxygenase AlkB